MRTGTKDILVLTLMALALAVLTAWGVTIGSSEIAPGDALAGLWSEGDQRTIIIVREVRLPRLLAAMLVGANLAVAGAIMQAVTANPMADPGLLGVNAGASFAVVLAIAFGGVTGATPLVWCAFAGAALAAALVFGLGTAGRGRSPIRLVLAGAVVASFLGALTMAILIADLQTFDAVRLWTAGSLKGRDLAGVLALAPYGLVALGAALLMRQQFEAMALGHEVASGLGQNQLLWQGIAAALVVGLAGSAVALAGPIGFVGLVVPHLIRLVIGGRYTRLLPFACVVGAGLTLLADTLPRAALGRNVPVGISLAVIGAPFFIWLARRHIGGRS